MLYVRYTEPASLLEISEDYMKGSEALNVEFKDFLKLIPYVWGPFRIEIEGETKSGGFSTKATIVPGISEYHTVRNLFRAVDIEEIIREVTRVKTVGYLRLDGVVRNISEPYKRVFVKLAVPKLGAVFNIEWYRTKTAKADVPRRVADAVIDTLRRYARGGQEAVRPTSDYVTVYDGVHRTKRDAEAFCLAIKEYKRCDFTEGKVYVISYRSYFSYISFYFLALGDRVPVGRPITSPCTCIIERYKDEEKERFGYIYTYVPPGVPELIRKL